MGRILLSICAVVVAVGLGGSAPQPPQVEQEVRQQDATARQQAPVGIVEPERNGKRRADQEESGTEISPLERADLTAQQAMAIFAGLQAVLTFSGLVYIRWTLKATREAVKEAKDATGLAETAFANQHENARRELRAYVSVDLEKVGTWGIGAPQKVQITIRNTGQTPARRLRAYGRVIVGNRGDEADIEIGEYDVATVTLGAGSFIVRERGTKKPLTSENLSLLRAQERFLICKGMIVYEDIFGDEQATHFSVDFGTAATPYFHKVGNDAT